jgi:hypothetical protein
MANSQINTQLVTMAIARGLYNKSTIATNFDQSFNKEYQKNMPVGATIYPRLPWRVVKKDGLDLQLQPLVDRVSSITMDQVYQYSVDFDSVEEALTLPRPNMELIEQIADPISDQFAQDLDSAAALWVLNNTSNVVGQLGSPITNLSVLRGATQKLIELAGWKKKMTGVVTPGVANEIVGLGQAFFNPNGTITDQFETMEVGKYANVTWNQSMSLYAQTAGSITAPTVTGANQSGGSLIITGANGDTLNVGDKIAIGSGATGMYAVNPATRRSVLALRVFTVTQAITLTGAADTIQISPAITGPGSQYQNVDALPQNGATVVLWPGTTAPNAKQGTCSALFAPDAFALVGAKLRVPKNIEFADEKTVPGTGISVRVTVTWDEVLSRDIFRCDSLFGFGNIEPENKSVLIAADV